MTKLRTLGFTQTCFPGNTCSLICMTLIHLTDQYSAFGASCVSINIHVVDDVAHWLDLT